MVNEDSGQLWGGRFKSESNEALSAISQSIHFDWRLARYDLIQTMAHATALLDSGILSATEFNELKKVCQDLSNDIQREKISLNAIDEDVHTAIERLITEHLPEVGVKVRTGRSRNDQVATDLRLYVRDQNQIFVAGVLDLMHAILKRANQYSDLPAPGYTHLQHAQPVTLGHELGKHAHALYRVCQRGIEIDSRIAVSPLGAGALAGSAFSSDVDKTAKILGFPLSADNSIDATTDRDYVLEFLFNAALAAVHISRLAEEIILMSTSEFGYINLDDAWSTGSSLMPQKKNPDIAELSRGKTGRFIGNLVSILTVLKALPFGYNRDLQEDKESLFDTVDQMRLILPAFTGLVSTFEVNTEKIQRAAIAQHAAATDVADYLVKKGMPFREAHRITGELVLVADDLALDIHQLPIAEFKKKSGLFESDLMDALELTTILTARNSKMGTSPLSVRRQLQELDARLTTIREWVATPLVDFL